MQIASLLGSTVFFRPASDDILYTSPDARLEAIVLGTEQRGDLILVDIHVHTEERCGVLYCGSVSEALVLDLQDAFVLPSEVQPPEPPPADPPPLLSAAAEREPAPESAPLAG